MGNGHINIINLTAPTIHIDDNSIDAHFDVTQGGGVRTLEYSREGDYNPILSISSQSEFGDYAAIYGYDGKWYGTMRRGVPFSWHVHGPSDWKLENIKGPTMRYSFTTYFKIKTRILTKDTHSGHYVFNSEQTLIPSKPSFYIQQARSSAVGGIETFTTIGILVPGEFRLFKSGAALVEAFSLYANVSEADLPKAGDQKALSKIRFSITAPNIAPKTIGNQTATIDLSGGTPPLLRFYIIDVGDYAIIHMNAGEQREAYEAFLAKQLEKTLHTIETVLRFLKEGSEIAVNISTAIKDIASVASLGK